MKRKNGCSFYKPLGCGKAGTFRFKPDWQQWCVLACWDSKDYFDEFYRTSLISRWWRLFKAERWTILLELLQSTGKWDEKEPFGQQTAKDHDGPVVVITHSRLRLKKMRLFWRNVGPVAANVEEAPGRIFHVNMGEFYHLPATFSVWDSVENMKSFAYKPGVHVDVIKRARTENWLAEDLFARFKPIAAFGTLTNADPLKGMITFDEL